MGMDREGRREVKAARRSLTKAEAEVTASSADVKSAEEMYESSKTNAEAAKNEAEKAERDAVDTSELLDNAKRNVHLAKANAEGIRKKMSSENNNDEARRAEEIVEAAEKMVSTATMSAHDARGNAEVTRERAEQANGNLEAAGGNLTVARAQLEYYRGQAKVAEYLLKKAHEKWGDVEDDADPPTEVAVVNDNENSEEKGKVGDEGRKKRQKTVSDNEGSSDVDSQAHVEADSAGGFGENDDGKASTEDGNLGGGKPHMDEKGRGRGKKSSLSLFDSVVLDAEKPSDVCSAHDAARNHEVREGGEKKSLGSGEGNKSQKTSASLPDKVLSESNMSDGGDEEANEDSRGEEGENLQQEEKRRDLHAPPLRGGAVDVPGRRQGPPSPHPPRMVTPTGLSPVAALGQVTEQEDNEKERFLMFARVLMKYLEQRNTDMHALAKKEIKECYEKNNSGDPEFKNLTTSMRSRLRATVGEHYWKKARDYLDHFLKKRERERELTDF